MNNFLVDKFLDEGAKPKVVSHKSFKLAHWRILERSSYTTTTSTKTTLPAANTAPPKTSFQEQGFHPTTIEGGNINYLENAGEQENLDRAPDLSRGAEGISITDQQQSETRVPKSPSVRSRRSSISRFAPPSQTPYPSQSLLQSQTEGQRSPRPTSKRSLHLQQQTSNQMSAPPSPGSGRFRFPPHYQHQNQEHRYSHSPAPYVEEPPMNACTKGGGKTLHVLINFVLLTASIILIATGAALMGFYRIHMLEVITVEFLIVPLFLIIGGVITLLNAVFGMYVTYREDSCLLITYAVFLFVEFLVLMAGIVASVRLLFDIQTGLFDADVIPELSLYETDSWVRYKWDTLQREFSCCGGYGYTLGYQDWKHTPMGSSRNSVPDSCCLYETPMCGQDVFIITDLRKVIGKIHTHGCLTTMLRRLETHVNIILLVFSVVGGLLAIVQLLAIVLACCMASQVANEDEEDWDYDYDGGGPGGGDQRRSGGRRPDDLMIQQQQQRPTTPQTMVSNDLSSHHETAF